MEGDDNNECGSRQSICGYFLMHGWYSCLCLCQCAKETDTVHDSSLSVFTFLVVHKSTLAESNPAAMGKGAYQATHINGEWTIFHKVVSDRQESVYFRN